MVNPVTGPIVEEAFNDLEGTGSYWRKRSVYKQEKPYNLSLPYTRWELRCDLSVPPGNGGASANAHAGHSPEHSWAQLFGKGSRHGDVTLLGARERFFDKLGAQSELSTTLGEHKQSIKMIKDRCNTLRQFAQALKKGDIRIASNVLAHGDQEKALAVRKKYGTSRSLANQWLELHFGWVPLVKDIFDAVDVLQSPIPLGKVRAKKKISFHTKGASESPGQWYDFGYGKATVSAYVGSHVRVSNPNLYLANRLGLVNPASLAWELTPWSFVVDWFSTVGAFLGQFTDTMGLTLENPWHGIKTEHFNDYTYVIVGNGINPWHHMQTNAEGFFRYQGLPDVNISLRPLKGLSVERAATAMSLLIQKLPKY